MSVQTIVTMAAVAALLLGARNANADPAVEEQAHGPMFGITAGGGAIGFADDRTNDIIEPGVMWEVRGIFGVNQPLAIEAAYLGSYQTIDVQLFDAALVGNGLEGAARLNIGTLVVQPHVVAGAGWMHYDLRVNEMAADFPGDDDVFTLSAGAGISFYAGPALIDVRANYRWAFDDDLLKDAELSERTSLDSFSATARAGMTF